MEAEAAQLKPVQDVLGATISEQAWLLADGRMRPSLRKFYEAFGHGEEKKARLAPRPRRENDF